MGAMQAMDSSFASPGHKGFIILPGTKFFHTVYLKNLIRHCVAIAFEQYFLLCMLIHHFLQDARFLLFMCLAEQQILVI